jgi:hypothetical protein
MIALYAKRSICECGFPVLADDIPIGAVYEVDPKMSCSLNLMCGGCGMVLRNLPSVWVERRGSSQAGYLPAAIFEIDEGMEKK